MQWKFEKILRAFDLIALKYVARTSLNSDDNTFYRQSTCYQKVLRIPICLKQTFSNSISLGLMEYYVESATVLISAVFLTGEHVDFIKVV